MPEMSGRGRNTAARPHRDRTCGFARRWTAADDALALRLVDSSTARAAASSAVLRNYRPITAERLKMPADGDWLMVRHTYDGWGYSPLDPITPANVARLQPVWVMSMGVNDGHQSPPFVSDGAKFVTTSFNQLIALDAKTGEEFWRYRSPYPEGSRVSKPVNRGVALYGDKVFSDWAGPCFTRSTCVTEKNSGRRRSRRTKTAIAGRPRPPLPMAKRSWEFPAATGTRASSSRPTTSRPARKYRVASPFPRLASPATRRGPWGTPGKRESGPHGLPTITMSRKAA